MSIINLFDHSNFFMVIDWYGPHTKPVNRAAFSAHSRKADLEKWQEEDRRFRHVAVISEEEVDSLESLLSRNPFSINQGHYKPKQIRQQYVIIINTGKKDYYLELGFSKKINEPLKLIRDSLKPKSRRPINRIIDQVRLWKY